MVMPFYSVGVGIGVTPDPYIGPVFSIGPANLKYQGAIFLRI
jgi:hypothetical protein